jgi:hypothetical protein
MSESVPSFHISDQRYGVSDASLDLWPHQKNT